MVFTGVTRYDAAYNCTVPGYVAPFTGKEDLVNGSGKVTFVCSYANISTTPKDITFVGRTAADGEHLARSPPLCPSMWQAHG